MKTRTKLIGSLLVLIVVFGISFFFFYRRAQQNLPQQPLILTPAVLNQPLPPANLVDVSGKQLDESKLRRGKIILIFTLTECKPCDDENEFLKSVLGMRKDVAFYGVIPFGDRAAALKKAESKYAFETFFDDHSMLSRSLQIYQVPIKIFVENGTIRKTWLDATVDSDQQAAFKTWLNGL
jgi:hypothetical protein